MAFVQERLQRRWKAAGLAKRCTPGVGDRRQGRIQRGAKHRHRLGQRIGEVLVFAPAEIVPLHHDAAAEPAAVVIHGHKPAAGRGVKQGKGGVAMLGQAGGKLVRGDVGRDRGVHALEHSVPGQRCTPKLAAVLIVIVGVSMAVRHRGCTHPSPWPSHKGRSVISRPIAVSCKAARPMPASGQLAMTSLSERCAGPRHNRPPSIRTFQVLINPAPIPLPKHTDRTHYRGGRRPATCCGTARCLASHLIVRCIRLRRHGGHSRITLPRAICKRGHCQPQALPRRL